MLKFTLKQKFVLVILLALAVFLSCQQDQTLQQGTNRQLMEEPTGTEMLAVKGMIVGSIMDAETSEPLSGASIFTADTQYGAASNFAGNFEILLPAGKYTIKTQMLGFAAQSLEGVEVHPGEQTEIQFKLHVADDRQN